MTHLNPHEWLPKEMSQPWKDSWLRWFDREQDYYSTVTKPYFKNR